MKRITRRIGESIDFVDSKGYANLSHKEGVRLLFERLAEYEDIGMTADEIKYFLRDFGISQAIEIRDLKKNNVKSLVLMLSSLKYPDKLFIYDNKELAWQGYISEKQIYKHLKNKEVVEIYLGEDGLIAKVN